MKPLEELKKDFEVFYYNSAKPMLADYEKNRKYDMPVLLSVHFLIGSFFAFWASLFINILIVPSLILFIVALIIYFYITSHAKSERIETTTLNGIQTTSININPDYEMYLKKSLMPEFLKVFSSDLKWFKPNQAHVSRYKETNLLNDLRIFPNTKIVDFDDCFTGKLDDLPFQIMELKTGLKVAYFGIFHWLFNKESNSKNLPLIFFLVFWLLPILTFILLIFCPILIIFCPLFVIFFLAVVFFVKIYSYKNSSGSSIQALAISYKIPKPFTSNTIIVENLQSIKNYGIKSTTGLEKVVLEDVRFNKTYSVYSNDQVESRYLLTTGFIERFNNIKTAFHSKFIRAEFKNGKLVLLMGLDKDLFKMGKITEQTTYMTFLELFSEFYSVLSLAEQLNIDSKTGL